MKCREVTEYTGRHKGPSRELPEMRIQPPMLNMQICILSTPNVDGGCQLNFLVRDRRRLQISVTAWSWSARNINQRASYQQRKWLPEVRKQLIAPLYTSNHMFPKALLANWCKRMTCSMGAILRPKYFETGHILVAMRVRRGMRGIFFMKRSCIFDMFIL